MKDMFGPHNRERVAKTLRDMADRIDEGHCIDRAVMAKDSAAKSMIVTIGISHPREAEVIPFPARPA